MQLTPAPSPEPSEASPEARPAKSHAFAAFLGGCVVMAGLFVLSEGSGPSDDSVDVHLSKSAPSAVAEVERGKQLAQKVCTACHQVPSPEVTDRYQWALRVLPSESNREGVGRPSAPPSGGVGMWSNSAPVMVRPAISASDWKAICSYYLAKAPLALPEPPPRPAARDGLRIFRPVAPQYQRPPETTLIKINGENGTVFVGNMMENRLDVITASQGTVGSIRFESPPVGVVETAQGIFVTLVGKYRWSDEPAGRVVFVSHPEEGKPLQTTDVATGLRSPSETIQVDMNKDGREDLLVVEHGNLEGGLWWFEKLEDGTYKPHVIFNQTAIVKAQLLDLQKDGLPEIFVMSGGAQQSITLLLNRGNGEFIPMPIVTKQPGWGWTWFELADFNRDGAMDILTSSGDNSYYGNITPLKPNHGVRIYMNDGKNQFTEAMFYPIHGATKAVARDFDKDGDLDIAVVSYYPDYNHSGPNESFLYLENTGRSFDACTAREALTGRWNNMDAGDVDGDGDIDIVLGANNSGPGNVPAMLMQAWNRQSVPVMVMLNQTVPNAPSGPARPSQIP